MANKWTPNSDCFSAAPLISYTEDCDTNTAGSLLIKLFVLVLPVGNNKALKPGRAEEPQVSCSLSRQNGFASLSPKALTFRGSCLLPHLGGSWVIMEGDYWVLVGRRRHQLIISETKSSACWGGWLDCYLNTIILHSKKNPLVKRLNKGPQGLLNQRALSSKKSNISLMQNIRPILCLRGS